MWATGVQSTALIGEAWVMCPCVVGVSAGHSCPIPREAPERGGGIRGRRDWILADSDLDLHSGNPGGTNPCLLMG